MFMHFLSCPSGCSSAYATLSLNSILQLLFCFVSLLVSPQHIERRLETDDGARAFDGSVAFETQDLTADDDEGAVTADNDDGISDAAASPSSLMLRMSSPASLWPLYVCNKLRNALVRDYSTDENNKNTNANSGGDEGTSAASSLHGAFSSFSLVTQSHVFADRSFDVSPLAGHGTLLDAALAYARRGACMHETLAMFYGIEMLRCAELLHAAGIVHGNLKAANFHIRNGAAPSPSSSSVSSDEEWGAWTPDRRNGWRRKGVTLVNFGAAVDAGLLLRLITSYHFISLVKRIP
jgi:hypothetical protein